MNREVLHTFFEGHSTLDEENQIKLWLQESTENRQHFMRERLSYDAMLMAPSTLLDKKTTKFAPLIPWITSAASVLLLLIISGLYFINSQNSDLSYNTLIVPPGQRINLILADQTNVWLNANTKFQYPTHFSKKNRTVFLDGEAYFEVAENKKSPFVVKTSSGDVQVTGTKFNVEAYSHMSTFATSLFEGGVDIYRNENKLLSLKPNEKSTLIDGDLMVTAITDTDEYLWRRGLIAFNDKKLEDIIISLEKYFAIDIKVNNTAMPQHTYSGKFRQADGVDYALRVLQKSIHFTFERDETTNIIYIK